MNELLIYIGAVLTLAWGIAHLFPTKSVVKGFGNITEDNRRIITMEWITEGVTLIFIGLVAAVAVFVDPAATVTLAVIIACAAVLAALAAVSLFTGFRIRFLPYRLCPVIFTLSAVLFLAGVVL